MTRGSRPSAWRPGHLVAGVELACAVVVVAVCVVLGVEAGAADRSLLDYALPWVIAVAVGGGLTVSAVRSWRTADADSGPSTRSRRSPGSAPAPARLPVGTGHEVARVVDVLAAAGVLAPEPPAPAQLDEAVADLGGPVTADVVLAATSEAAWWHPGFEASRHTENLAFHESHAEQDVSGLQRQAHDVVRLLGAASGVKHQVVVQVELAEVGSGPVPTTLRVLVAGEEQIHTYAGAASYLSTVLHVALARALRARAAPVRLAWLWSDQGVWLAALPALPVDRVDRLNAELGPAAGDGWTWVDEQPPIAAGDLYVAP